MMNTSMTCNRFGKPTYLLATLLLGTVSLTGCNKPAAPTDNQPASSPTSSQNNAPPAPKANQPTYKVSITSTTPPFAFLDEKGQLQGLDVDLVRRIGELEGFNVSFTTSNWNGMFSAIDTGKSDMAVSGISFTPERSQKYNLSQSYIINPSAIIFKEGAMNFQTLADAKGHKIAATDGGKSQAYAKSVQGATVETENAPFLMLQKVTNGQADAAIYDKPVLEYLVAHHPEHKMTIVALDRVDDPTAQTVVLMPKDKTELLAKVNDALGKMQQQGELDKLKTKWQIK